MTTIEVMRQALEALEHAEKDAADFQRINTDQTGAAITALRAEIERLEAAEPVAWGMVNAETGLILDVICPEEHTREPGSYTVPLYTAPIAPAAAEPVARWKLVPVEPVAWLHPSNASCVTTDPTAYARGIPLYAAATPPVAIPALTREEFEDQVPATLYSADERGTFATGARWAYALAAERAGVQIK